MDEGSSDYTEHEACMGVCVCTCWSSATGGPGLCWGPAGQERVGVCATVCAGVHWRVGWMSPRIPVMGSSRNRWPRSRCGSDSGAYPPPHL